MLAEVLGSLLEDTEDDTEIEELSEAETEILSVPDSEAEVGLVGIIPDSEEIGVLVPLSFVG